MSKRIAHLSLFILLLVYYSYTYFQQQIHMLPSRIHSWAQADRLSLAFGFYDDGMNFFKPTSFTQFSKGGVVGVEFPIQAYIAAALGHVFGRNHINAIFRLEDIIISCLGLLFLYLAVYKRTQSFLISIFTPLFIFSSPVFIYYTCNYMPDTAGASIAFIAFYFILDYFDSPNLKNYFFAVLLLTLGSLIKTSIAIYLLSFLGLVFIETIVSHKKNSLKQSLNYFIVAILFIGILIVNYIHIQYLNKEYNATLFLSKPSPFANRLAIKEFFENELKHKMLKEYFLYPQYLLFAIIFSVAIPFILKEKNKLLKIGLLAIQLFGVSSMFLLMGGNMGVHDYYFIAIFIPFFAYFLLISVLAICQNTYSIESNRSLRIASLCAVIIMFFFADFSAFQRLSPDYPGWSKDYNTAWLENRTHLMDSLYIPKQEKIVVIDDEEPNTPLIYLDRKGYVYPHKVWGGEYLFDVEKKMREHHLRFLIIENKNRIELTKVNDTLFRNFDYINTFDQVAIYKYKGQ